MVSIPWHPLTARTAEQAQATKLYLLAETIRLVARTFPDTTSLHINATE